MDELPTNVTYVTNDTEESFVYEKDGIRTNLSILGPAGDDPICICRSQWKDGIDAPLRDEKFHIPSDEKGLLSELISRSTIL
jgi:hypothetical protein